MSRIRIGAPLSLLVVFLCVLGTYIPGATGFGVPSGVSTLVLPWTWIRLVTWPFVHSGTAHLFSNMMLFLILSPGLERRLGFGRYMLCLAGTAVFVGLGHIAFGSQNSILGGASGWVFMMIILATFAGNEPGTVSIPTILVGVMYAGQEIGGALGPGNVSHLAHLLGGVCGLAAGMVGLVRDEKVRHAPTESLVAASNGRAG